MSNMACGWAKRSTMVMMALWPKESFPVGVSYWDSHLELNWLFSRICYSCSMPHVYCICTNNLVLHLLQIGCFFPFELTICLGFVGWMCVSVGRSTDGWLGMLYILFWVL
jgi:hypothetical protein